MPKKEKDDNKIVKIVKVEIDRIVGIKEDHFNVIAKKLQSESLDMRNQFIAELWKWNNFEDDYKTRYYSNPDTKEYLFNKKKGSPYGSIRGYAEDVVKENKISYSGIISANTNKALSRWNKFLKDRENYREGKYPAIPCFTRPEILFRASDTEIIKKDAKYECKLPLLGRDGVKIADLLVKKYEEEKRIEKLRREELKKEYKKLEEKGVEITKEIKDKLWIKVKNKIKERSEEELKNDEPIITSSSYQAILKLSDTYDNTTIINRIINGEYKMGESSLRKLKNKWMLFITYSFEKQSKGLDPNIILGVDIGVNDPAHMVVYDSNNRKWGKKKWIDGKEIEAFRKKRDAMKRSIQKQAAYCGEGRRGHGRKTRMNAVEKIDGMIKRFKNTCNHKYSRFIVDFALKNNCGVIQMENLSGIADGEKKATFLGDWTFYDLQQKIKYKADEVGIKVIFIKPNHTSARCSNCGFIHDNKLKDIWRPETKQFKCMKCDYGHRRFVHADDNAARNISLPNIENIIEEQLDFQNKEAKHALKYIAE